MPSATIAIPTSGRADYLAVALASIVPQAAELDAEVIVVADGAEVDAPGARVLSFDRPRGLNAARNAAIAEAGSDLIIFVDDDVEAPAGWLAAYLAGAAEYADHDVLGGPIRARLDGGPRHCGREPAPITTLDLGAGDRDAKYVWGANMAVRRAAITRIGSFDESLAGRGDEEEWLDRLHAEGGRVRYLAGAGLDHRRCGADARLGSLLRAGYALGASARANDVRKGRPPSLTTELRDLAGAGWHMVANRCAYGAVFGAHSLGRIQETLLPQPVVAPASSEVFESGQSGYVAGVRAVSRARVGDAVADGRGLLTGRRLGADAARWGTPRSVLVAAIERADQLNLLAEARAELSRSAHGVTVVSTDVGGRGRFENLNLLIESHLSDAHEWLLILDDDVELPRGFLDRFLFLAERFELSIAQPAHRSYSHAAWPVTRRRAGSLVRETAFVEIGPIVAFRRNTFESLLPFPSLRVGWGVDSYWAALAQRQGWRIGVVDATAIEHALRPVAASYDRESARSESQAFLAAHPHISAVEADRTLLTHSRY